MAGRLLAQVPATMPGACWGRAPGKADSMYHKVGRSPQKSSGCCFLRTNRSALFGGDCTDVDGVAIQGAGDGRVFAGLLVERGQSSLVGGIQNVNLFAHD